MRKSFSLVELLIVVTIISVLTGAALPFVSEYLNDARVAKVRNDMDEIARAINAYETVTGLDYSDTTGKALVGRFIQKIPIDPWGTPISLASATEANGAYISSAGPDHVFGGDDDIKRDYKGKLAIVSAKWFDVNGDGKISIADDPSYPSTDTLTVRFNRAATYTSYNVADSTNDPFTLSSVVTYKGLFENATGSSIASVTVSSDDKQWVISFGATPTTADQFYLGTTEIQFRSATGNVLDMAGKPPVITGVTILAK